MKTRYLFIFCIAFSNFLNGQETSTSCKPKLSLTCEPEGGVGCTTFTHKGFTYKIFQYSCEQLSHATVQRGKNGHWETIYDIEDGNVVIELRDVDGDNRLDIVVENKAIHTVSLFNPLTGKYVHTGQFGGEIGFCNPKWRVNDYFITRFEDRFDVLSYNLYKMVDYKQITVGKIDFHVLNNENVTGIEVFKMENGDLDKPKLVKTIPFNEVERHFFTKNRFLKVGFRDFNAHFKQDDFARYYFTKHFKEFTADLPKK